MHPSERNFGSGAVGNAATKLGALVIGPVQDEINNTNGRIDDLERAISNLIEQLEPVLGAQSPSECGISGGSPSHCNLHARLMGVTERVVSQTDAVNDAIRRLKL